MNLDATLGAEDTTGVFEASNNTFVMTEAQIQTLMEGNAYANIHTEEYASGEIRGQFLSASNSAPTMVEINFPDDEAEFSIKGSSSSMFEANWTQASDTNGNEVTYIWQLSTDAEFNNIIVDANTGSQGSFQATFGTLDSLLADIGIETGGSAIVYHRVIASDGSDQSTSSQRSATMMRGEVTSTEEVTEPHEFALQQNYPNPFNPTTSIKFSLSEASQAVITVYNMLGQEVGVIANDQFSAGQHSVEFDASELSSGIYIYTLEAAGKTLTKKMTLLK